MNDHETQQRAEITKELRTARRYLIGVGILMVMMDLAYLFVIYKDQSPPEVLRLALAIDAFILVAFTTLGILVPKSASNAGPKHVSGRGLV